MNKMLTILGVISLLGLGLASGSNAAGSTFEWGLTTSETIDLLGAPVSDPAGEMLGTINAFVNDSEGHVAFAILWQGVLGDNNAARYVAVPFSALSISGWEPEQMTVVLNIDKRTLDAAPSLDNSKDLNNTEWAISIYRYFGQMPYWTSEEAEKVGPATNSPEVGSSESDSHR